MADELRFLTGARAIDTFIYGYNKYPYNLLGPATVLWHATSQEPAKPEARSAKGKEKATTDSDDITQRIRLVWVRVHPSITGAVYQALRISASFALDAAKQEDRVAEVEIADMREHFNVFEIVGPKSSQVIKGALKPIADQRQDFKKVSENTG